MSLLLVSSQEYKDIAGSMERMRRSQNNIFAKQKVKLIRASGYKKPNMFRFKCEKDHYWNAKMTDQLHVYPFCPECHPHKKVLVTSKLQARDLAAKLKPRSIKIRYMGSYIDRLTKIDFLCLKCKKIWHTMPAYLMRGTGCPYCAVSGFDQTSPGILYYLRVEHLGQVAYKIGITNYSVKKRFKGRDIHKITILKVWEYTSGEKLFQREQELMKTHSSHKYDGPPLLKNGNTELFNTDVLGYEV